MDGLRIERRGSAIANERGKMWDKMSEELLWEKLFIVRNCLPASTQAKTGGLHQSTTNPFRPRNDESLSG